MDLPTQPETYVKTAVTETTTTPVENVQTAVVPDQSYDIQGQLVDSSKDKLIDVNAVQPIAVIETQEKTMQNPQQTTTAFAGPF